MCIVPSPEARAVPATGDCDNATDISQLSVAVEPSTTFVTMSWQLAFNTTEAAASQVAVGAVTSSPVSTTVQVEVLPLPSFAVTTIVCVMPSPEARAVPAVGDCDSVGTVQLSVAVEPSTTFVTMSWQLASNTTGALASQVAVGALVSSPVNTTVQVAVLPLLSLAVTVMVWVVPSPEARAVPTVGLCVQVMEPEEVQLSVADEPSMTFVTTNWQLAFNTIVAGPSQVGVGGVVSSPVKMTEQVEVLPAGSVAVTTIVWVVPSPEASAVPAVGLCVSVTGEYGGLQLSVVVVPSVTFVTTNSQLPFNTMVAAASQVTAAGSLSTTVTVKPQVAVRP